MLFGYASPRMEDDVIDTLIAQWGRVRPDLDARPMRTSGRILRLARILEQRTEAVLSPFGLSLWQFDVLATLRRTGHDLSPGDLLKATLLTSGAMTHRLDRLEADGWIERRPDPKDRRGVRVRLTPAGRRLVDRAVKARLEEAARIEDSLGRGESETLAELLRRVERGATGS
jgi:DNA-binding MarR family transcriptional regulator